MKTSFLLLWLESALQSWGADSKFGRRDSLPFPTKSGITGLLLCALGASGNKRVAIKTGSSQANCRVLCPFRENQRRSGTAFIGFSHGRERL